MHAVVDFTKTRHVTDVFVLTTSCFAVRFRASFKGKASYVQHLKPTFQRTIGKENPRIKNGGCSVKRHDKLRYPVKFPCSLLEFYHEQGPQLLSVIQQHEG